MWMILPYRSVIEVTGVDRFSFLQGLITQDVTKLTAEKPLYSLCLTNTGRFFCDFFVVSSGESVFLTPGTEYVNTFQKKLLFYKLRSAVQIYSRPEWVVAINLQKSPSLPQSGIVFHDPRLLELGIVFLGSPETLEEVTRDHHLYDLHRLTLGVPEGPLDLESEKSIPLESWMDELNAISWEKGCFLGQELTSRTKHVGKVRKKLLSFSSSKPLSKSDLLFHQTGVEIGRVVSTYQEGQKGFALINTEKISADRKVFTDQKQIVVSVQYPKLGTRLP